MIETEKLAASNEVITVVYNFTVKGRYPDGTRARIQGTVNAPDGYPSAAFDAAVKACQEVTPEIIVDREKRGQVVIRKKKR
jgi:hypothetical protein